MISSENGLLRGTVLLNVRGRDVGSFVDEAKDLIRRQVQMPLVITSSGAASTRINSALAVVF